MKEPCDEYNSDKKETEVIQLEPKTEAVITKKGYRIEKKLNEGAFGQVYKASVIATGEVVAVKVMNLEKLGEKFQQKFLPRELEVLTKVTHENIICIHLMFRAGNKIFVFMEYANGGDITGYLSKNGPIKESLTCYWFTQVCEAMKYLHKEKIAHRDMKIDNVLLHNNIAKVTDFGFARVWQDKTSTSGYMSDTFCGTEPYYCPQIVSRKPYNAFCSDVWAMGVLLFCMLNNKFPFHFGNAKAMYKEQTDRNYIKSRYTKQFPPDLCDLQEKLLDPNETTRITVADALKHPWIIRRGK